MGPIALHGFELNCPSTLFLIGKEGILWDTGNSVHLGVQHSPQLQIRATSTAK